MKIKVCISNFGNSQLNHLERVIKEFKSYNKHEVDIKIFTTVPLKENHILFPESVTSSLPFMCRKEMYRDLENYDLFIFNENDHLITEDNIEAFIEFSKTIQENQLCGFIRYEQIYGINILVDHNPYYHEVVDKVSDNIFTCFNNHQGCWVLFKKDLKKAIESGNFLVNPHEGPYGILEQGASDPYTQCGMEKVFPLDPHMLKRLMIRHLPVKYSIKNEWISHGIFIDGLYENAIIKK
jgi:hypothetical protein